MPAIVAGGHDDLKLSFAVGERQCRLLNRTPVHMRTLLDRERLRTSRPKKPLQYFRAVAIFDGNDPLRHSAGTWRRKGAWALSAPMPWPAGPGANGDNAEQR
jgi:hypothetical protein